MSHKKPKPLSSAETAEAKQKRTTALFVVELLDGTRQCFSRLRADEPPMDRVKSVDINRLIIKQPGSTMLVTSNDDERMRITYLGQLSESEFKKSIGYVYMLHGLGPGSPSGPTRSVKDIAEFFSESNLAPMRVEILDEEKANMEIEAIVSESSISKRSVITCESVDSSKMHVSYRTPPSEVEAISLCGVECIKTNLPYLAWGNGKAVGKTWCRLCHAISVELGRIY